MRGDCHYSQQIRTARDTDRDTGGATAHDPPDELEQPAYAVGERVEYESGVQSWILSARLQNIQPGTPKTSISLVFCTGFYQFQGYLAECTTKVM